MVFIRCVYLSFSCVLTRNIECCEFELNETVNFVADDKHLYNKAILCLVIKISYEPNYSSIICKCNIGQSLLRIYNQIFIRFNITYYTVTVDQNISHTIF